MHLIKEGFIKGVQPAFGILFLYTLIGISIIFLGNSIKHFIPVFEPIVGVIIVCLGIFLLTKSFSPKFLLVNRLSKFIGDGKFDLFIYGIIYGMAAAGCTMPIFISIIFLAISFGGFFSGMVIFLFYVTGMMGLMIAITLLIAGLFILYYAFS